MQLSQMYLILKTYSADQNYNSKKENFDAANCNKPNIFTFSQTPTRIGQ